MNSQDKLVPNIFESKWQRIWEQKRIYQPDLKNAKRPYYNLMMFPYPSAEGLHVGNVYAFTGADINGRYKRMRGFDVFEPIGLDGFGIHSENYAIKIGRNPAEQAKISEKHFYEQLHQIGNSFAWENKLETYDPAYYKWTQWIFVQMFKHGLAYRKKSAVNFCPSCKTVLSDEQVINKVQGSGNNQEEIKEVSNSVCERCGTPIEKREMEQWFFRITTYAEKLLQNTYKKTFDWTEKVKIGQRNWIGKKEGINISYPIVSSQGDKLLDQFKKSVTITCFTTRPDTNFGATFVVIGPEHSFVKVILNLFQDPKGIPDQVRNDKKNEIKVYIEKAKKKSETERIAEGRDKTGVFTGFYAINQLNNYKMPIYISDFVLGNVGTGAVVGVPGHDLRDFQFAKKFKIPIIRVVIGRNRDQLEITREDQVQEEVGKMINSGFLNGLDIHKATIAMMDYLEQKGWGKRITTYKLRDWCISRQRYWGAPIPMIYCDKCGWKPVSEDQLPVLLPEDVKDWKPEGTGKGPLAKIKSFIETKCPNCGGYATRETDVCDTFLDSSWYHLRYPSINAPKPFRVNPQGEPPLNLRGGEGELPWNPQITRRWLPVTQYIGGAEHTVLHLLYARFIAMALKDMGYLDFEEPYTRFFAHGLIIAEGAKMSKSRGNVIVPDQYIKKYGADTLRTYLMFLGPYDAGGDFRDTGIAGMYRFLGRVWRLVISCQNSEISNKAKLNEKPITENQQLITAMHHTIKEVSEDMENFRYNTAIAHIMEYVNQLLNLKSKITNPKQIQNSKSKKNLEFGAWNLEFVKVLLLLLAPFAPHMTEELWHQLSEVSNQLTVKKTIKSDNRIPTTEFRSIHLHPWPTFDPKYLTEELTTIIVQVNGKLRETIRIKNQESRIQNTVEEEAKRSKNVAKYLAGKEIRKVIFVPGKLINFVI